MHDACAAAAARTAAKAMRDHALTRATMVYYSTLHTLPLSSLAFLLEETARKILPEAVLPVKRFTYSHIDLHIHILRAVCPHYIILLV